MALANLRKGTEEIRKSAESGGGAGKFTPFIGWKDQDTKLIYFLTPAEEIARLRLHNFVEFQTDDGSRYDTLVCRKDPAFRDESGNTCDLCDRVGHAATEKHVALAIELEPVKDGKKIIAVKPAMRKYEDREGNEKEVPQVGLVVQASTNFFAPYVAWGSRLELEETSFEVQREGASTNTKYYFFPVNEKPDLSEFDLPSLDDVIERMGSEEKYEAVSELQPGSQKTWGDSKKKNTSGKAGATEQTGNLESQFAKIKEEVKAKKGSEKSEVETY